MASFWGKRRRADRAAQNVHDADLARRAEQSLVAADEHIRTTADELEFAQVELGDALTADLAAALESVRVHMREAFQLHQLNHDATPDTDEELRTRNARIIQLCEWAESLLTEKTQELTADVARVRRAPEIIGHVRTDADALQARLQPAREATARLSTRYAESAVQQVAASADEAEQLLAFARHSADVTERRHASGQNPEALVALETATEAIRRATALLDAVDDFEIHALRAESTLTQVVADSRNSLHAARTAPRAQAVIEAESALERALLALPAAGARTDPFAELSRLREANTALDDTIAQAHHRSQNPLPTVEQVQHALDDADRQLGVARGLISGHRGWIGADARTRLAEAERLRSEVTTLLPAEQTREQALVSARRVAQLASEALHLAQRDIDSARPPHQSGWGGPPAGGGNGNGLVSGILGGLVIGSLLDGIFD